MVTSRRVAVLATVALLTSAAQVAQGQNEEIPIDLLYQNTAVTSAQLADDGSVVQGDIVETVVALTPDGDVTSREQTVRAPAAPVAVAAAAAEAEGPNGCDDESTNPGFTTHRPPLSIVDDHPNEKGLHQGFLYSVDRARKGPEGQPPTFQVLMCAVGGIDAEHGSRITVAGPGVYVRDSQTPYVINKVWREGKTPKSHTIELGFEVPLKDAKVTAKFSQNPTENLKGSIRPPYESDAGEWFINAAHGWWEDGCHPKCRWRFQGSGDYHGSTVEGLWEFSQAEKALAVDRGFWLTRHYQHHCANPTGCP